MDLTGKVAVVTGGSGGLGQRICHALAREGCHIAVVYAASTDVANSFCNELRDAHEINAQAIQCDVSEESDVQRMVGEVVTSFGQLDILINDAAYNKAIPYKDLDDLTLEVWSKILAVNLTGPMMLCKAVAPIMERQGAGRIVNVSSVAGIYPGGSSIAYAVSKAGLNHLTRCMAVALAPHTLV
ncbi:MAG: SDR family oxidoreductase, partial [Pseudomonadota bacterium]